MKARMGNSAPVHYSTTEGELWTDIDFPDGISVDEAVVTVTDPNGVWVNQSLQRPLYVASDNPELELALSNFYGCEIRSIPGINMEDS